MKSFINYLFIFSAIIPATYLLFLCLLVLGEVVSDFSFNSESILYLLIGLSGIMGYLGLLFLFAENRIKNAVIIMCLSLGVISLIIFTSIQGIHAWKWILTMEEPDEWFILVWPSIVSVVQIIRIIIRRNSLKPL